MAKPLLGDKSRGWSLPDMHQEHMPTATTRKPRTEPEPTPQLAVGLYSYQIGGSERIGADLAMCYHARGYRVFCFALHDSDGPVRDRLEKAGVECMDLNYLRRPRGIRRRIGYQINLARLLQKRRVRALHLHHTTALILAGIPSRLMGVPAVLMTEHAIHELEASTKYKSAARFYCKFAHEISVVHAGLVEYFYHQIHVPKRKLHYIPNAVTIPKALDSENARISTRHCLAAQHDEFVFLFLGRLHPTKDLTTLLTASAIASRSRRFTVWLVGEGPERPLLERQAVEMNLEGIVRFVGAASDVTPFLAAADAFVMSSATEGLPMALLEAMAHSLPCIATAVGGIPELLENGTGIVVPPKDPQRLAQAMTRLIDDLDLRSTLARCGREKAESEFDLEQIADRYLELMKLPPTWPPLGDSRAN